FSALFGHVSFPFAVVTNNSPLLPSISSTCSWSGERDVTTTDRNDIIWLMASMGSSPCLNTGTVRPNIVETDKVIHTVETDIVKLVVEIESFGMSFDEFDKETGSSDGLQPKQADLNCVHALNELHLHEIRVVPSKHEADQY
ncbi:hypothetical protein Tco_0425433, partial [Tanacetum coccineum]